MSVTLIFKDKERREYGNKEPSRFVPSEKGRSPIFVLSDGALEKEEIDDIVLAAQEKEDKRIKRRVKRHTQRRLEEVTQEVLKAKPKERAKTGRALISQQNRWI